MITIAIAEDHLHMREVMSEIISEIDGYSVSIKSDNGFKLLEKLNSTNKIPQIAIVDIEMPVMDGLATTFFISKCYPNIKILTVSNHNHHFIVRDMLEAGSKGYILKENLSKHHLLKALNLVKSGYIYIDENIEGRENLISKVRCDFEDNSSPEITDREKIFLQLTTTGASYDQIANLMHIAPESIYNFQKKIKSKIGLSTRQEYIIYAIQHGIAKVARLNHSKTTIENSEF